MLAHAGTVVGNFQGASGIGVKNATINFTLMQAGLLSGTGSVVPTAVSCYTDGSGNVVGLPNLIASPTASVNLSSGGLPGGIYYVVETWINAAGVETAPSPELRIQLSSTGSLILAAPASVPPAATGLRVYAGTTSGGETLQGVAGTNTTFTLGSPLTAGVSPPSSNATTCSIAFNDQIIPYTGYTLTLISSSGTAYPGFPQNIQLNGGPNGTVNVSNGLPYWNGTVIYPMPLLAQPLNHGPQSISGNLDHGGYNDTNIGTLTAGSVNTTINANLQSGADIGAKINAALASCAQQCSVYVPAGAYSFATTIQAPLNTYGTYGLTFDPGAVLTYTGTGDMIASQINTNSITGSNRLIIQGGQLFGPGTSTTANGIHTYPGNSITVRNMLIDNFANGILVEGTDVMQIYDNEIAGNNVGVKLIATACAVSGTSLPVCSPTTTGAVYTPNAIHIDHNMITFNTQWGIWDDGVLAPGSGSLNNVISENDLEQNGNSGTGQYGAVQIFKSVSDVIRENYFEGSPREIVLGQNTGGAGDYFGATTPVVRDNYFTTTIPRQGRTKAYNIELENTYNAIIEGNSEQGSPGISSSANCFINVDGAVEQHTKIGLNGIIQNATTGSGNPLCISGTATAQLAGTGSYSLINANYQPFIIYQNWITAASATETVPGATVIPASACYTTPVNAAAAADTGAYISAVGTGSVTFTHAAVANERFNIWCANNPNG